MPLSLYVPVRLISAAAGVNRVFPHKVALNDVANGNDNAMLGDRIKALETDVDQIKSATAWLYAQQNANHNSLRTCTVDMGKLRAALRDRYAVSVDVDCN